MTVYSYDDEAELLVSKNPQTAVDFDDAYHIYENLLESGYLKKINEAATEEFLVEIMRSYRDRQPKEVYESDPRLLEAITYRKELFIRVSDKLKNLPPEPLYLY